MNRGDPIDNGEDQEILMKNREAARNNANPRYNKDKVEEDQTKIVH